MDISEWQREGFLETLWKYYAQYGRHDLSWRQSETDGSFDPYKIIVSEIMLQQTQVQRVKVKYREFLIQFPTVASLAQAEFGDVLRTWQGLGYNRRAKFLWQAAHMIDTLCYVPATVEELIGLPGIGKNTAGAIMAYAYNKPVVFIETNIRTVYIHHFFNDQSEIADRDILALVQQTIDYEQPREFYWALMDYGSHLKATVGNLNKVSKQYVKQSNFHGSRRQIRGAVIKELGNHSATLVELQKAIVDERLMDVVNDLVGEHMVRLHGSTYSL